MFFLKKYYLPAGDAPACHAITHDVRFALRDAGVQNGMALVAVSKPGAAVCIGEGQQEARDALMALCESWRSIVSAESMQNHFQESVAVLPQVQSAVLGRTVALPVQDGQICLDPYSEVLLCEFDATHGRREFVVKVMGDSGQQAAPQEMPPMM